MCTPEDCEKCDGSPCAPLGEKGCMFKNPDGSWKVPPEIALATVLFPPIREASEIEIAVSRVRYKDGKTALFGTCEICKEFPCPHVTEQGYWATDHFLKLNSVEEYRFLVKLLTREFAKVSMKYALEPRYDVAMELRRGKHLLNCLIGELAKLRKGWK